MAQMTIGKGVDKYIESLDEMKYKVGAVAGRAIYEGAKIVADQVRSNIEALPVSDSKRDRGFGGRREPTQIEKDGMLQGLGIANKRVENGNINVKIGMDGYNADVTAKWPKGKPNSMIARSIEKGTTFINRHPFIASAVRSTREQAEAAMSAEVDKQIAEIMGDG